MGTEYMVGGVFCGLLILPHVRQSNWRRAMSKVVGKGGVIRPRWGRVLVCGVWPCYNNMDSLRGKCYDCEGERKSFSR
jgi:hypothetical protein